MPNPPPWGPGAAMGAMFPFLQPAFTAQPGQGPVVTPPLSPGQGPIPTLTVPRRRGFSPSEPSVVMPSNPPGQVAPTQIQPGGYGAYFNQLFEDASTFGPTLFGGAANLTKSQQKELYKQYKKKSKTLNAKMFPSFLDISKMGGLAFGGKKRATQASTRAIELAEQARINQNLHGAVNAATSFGIQNLPNLSLPNVVQQLLPGSSSNIPRILEPLMQGQR